MDQQELAHATELVSGLESRVAQLEDRLKNINTSLQHANELADALLLHFL
jgi:hypothetical protein